MARDGGDWTRGLAPLITTETVSDIVSGLADAALVISQSGVVQECWTNPGAKLNQTVAGWQGQKLSTTLAVESVPKFEERLAQFINDPDGAVRPVELNHAATSEHRELPVRYSFHRINGGQTVLLLGQDLRPVAEMQQQLVAAQIALEKDYEAHRETDTRLRVLLGSMREAVVFVSVRGGQITDCNTPALTLLGSGRGAVISRPLAEWLNPPDTRGEVMETLTDLARAQTGEETAVRNRSGDILSLRPTLFRATGEQMLLCQLARAGTGTQRVDGSDEHLAGLFNRGADGIVFLSKSGGILSANDAFLRLSDVVQATALKGRAIADFLGRGAVDFNVIIENATRTGAMRLYATRLVGEHGGEVPVEIATTLLGTGNEPVFAMVIRDASRAEMVRKSSNDVADVDMRSVIELIGSQTLKEIVANTTDVIEKMCIETAVELTSNNRVAAAEMLGLSRQSLYVKLRKYDLLRKGAEED